MKSRKRLMKAGLLVAFSLALLAGNGLAAEKKGASAGGAANNGVARVCDCGKECKRNTVAKAPGKCACGKGCKCDANAANGKCNCKQLQKS